MTGDAVTIIDAHNLFTDIRNENRMLRAYERIYAIASEAVETFAAEFAARPLTSRRLGATAAGGNQLPHSAGRTSSDPGGCEDREHNVSKQFEIVPDLPRELPLSAVRRPREDEDGCCVSRVLHAQEYDRGVVGDVQEGVGAFRNE